MNRARRSLPSLIIALPVLVFAIFCWLNWQPLRVVAAPDSAVNHRQTTLGEPVYELADAELWMQIGGGQALRARLGWLLVGTFGFGVLIGVLTLAAAVGPRRVAMRAELEALRSDKHRLGAANRALEAALPVLRERYDAALAGQAAPVTLEPGSSVLNEPIGDAATDAAEVGQMLLEDASAPARRRGRDRARSR